MPTPTPTATPTPTPTPEIDEFAVFKTVGNIVTFGSYEQDNNLDNGPEPIEWIVLEIQDGKCLLISRYALDSVQYNENETKVSWENSTLREWLNNDFYLNAFDLFEQEMIPFSEVENSGSAASGISEGNITKDRIFLLSYDEAKKFFSTPENRSCLPTPYAAARCKPSPWDLAQHGVSGSEDSCWWWLRSFYWTAEWVNRTEGLCVNEKGSMSRNRVNAIGGGIRPVIWVEPDAAEMAYTKAEYKRTSESLKELGNIVSFGHYEQDNNLDNGPEPIEWIVLDVQEEKSLLISKYALESRWFATREGARWDNSFIRDWLNSAFLHNAFAPEERAAIVLSDINNGYEEGGQGAYQGHSTKDKVFFLSYAEAWRYFPTEESRLCLPTAGAVQFTTVNHENCGWWLRSAYAKKSHIQGGYVTSEGVLGYSSAGEIGVRPAIWVWNKPEKLEELAQENLLEEETLTTGSSVFFGQYEQDGNQLNGKEPIEWKVINIDDNRCQLISKYILSQKNYEEHRFEEIEWNSSSLCEWLNGTFFEEAFNEEQAENILTLSNDDGSSRQIRVTLLDQTEYNKILLYSPDRICDSSRVGASNGKLGGLVGNGGIWWLQTLDLRKGHNAFCVNGSGMLTSQHIGVGAGVRPVIWVDLNSAVFIP